ncbi:MAG: Dihydrolipoyllysine-residue succinyltransferase component of 2-oxoglutarate dehydrogenase complex [Puniceicoccaceae bacterium MED-G32]|jgi:2-oxoglutarate dehydrogenase E2 component (dihydrolipoamide succinyltransferase)|nr:MAG: Dihydrolipoyllysine-residue succinyltransferase component of 2-oxoglutarate dehydrogenase complex [Puniceicoccaceae bacterium MED-G32]|tara:strand:+ start:11542 stop:12819 length:1278 start_codon:yes stop_codon:yes gene_type:complete
MAIEVKVPSMGESITSGILSAWLVKDGDFVEKDQPIYELETDKITSEATAEVSGVIQFKVDQDAEVDIGSTVATIDDSAKAPTNNEEPKVIEAKETPIQPTISDVNDAPKKEEEKKAQEVANSEKSLSPASRKHSIETQVDIDQLEGTGKDGRITKGDILSAKAPQVVAPKESTSNQSGSLTSSTTPTPADSSTRETRKKMSPLRKKIAQRLVNATQEAALLTTFNEVDMSRVMQLRKAHQESFVKRYGIKLGFMSFFTKAVVNALQSVPAVNARIEDNFIVQQHYYDIGIAVGTEKGLLVPVVRDCEQKSFQEIEQSILDFAKDARESKIQLKDLEGGVFTISNGGIYGSMLSTPIINFPQPAILGLHNIQERAVVVNGEIVARPMMYLALSYDHRLIDGKEAVTFLNHIKHAIENPDRLLIGL